MDVDDRTDEQLAFEVIGPAERALMPMAAARRVTEIEVLPPLSAMLVAGGSAPSLGENDKARLWPRCFEEWLTTDRHGRPRSANTQRAYGRAWEDFQAFTGKVYWRVTSGDVRAWLQDLRTRPVDPTVRKGLEKCRGRKAGTCGLAEATVQQFLAAVSSFYSFAARWMVPMGAGEIPLFADANPAQATSIARPATRSYSKSTYLDPAQCRALLGAISSFARVNAAKALRDRALFLCYLATAGRSSEVRMWRWRDIERRGGAVFYNWANKGKEGKDEIGSDAWHAVEEFLRATDRWDGMQPDDYIFCPLTDRAMRLPNIRNTSWTRNRPLSGREVGRLLKFYAGRAGLDADALHVHTLRHSAYMLYREAGVSLEERSRLLHHSSLAITSIYDHAVAGQRNVGWAKCASLLGL